MRLITKLWTTLLLLCIAGVANAAKTYEVDQKFTSIAALDGQAFAIVNEAEGKAVFGSGAQNLGYDSITTAVTGSGNSGYYFKLEASTVEGAYLIRLQTPAGEPYNIWGSPGYLNSGAPGGFDGCFILGLNSQNGQDVENGAVWEIEYAEGLGFTLKNKALGGYFAGPNPAPTAEAPIYWTFCTLKEGEEVPDPEPVVIPEPEAPLAEGELIPDFFSICDEGGIPYGYDVKFNGEDRAYPATFSGCARMFNFAEGGDFTKAIYYREGYVQYGNVKKLALEAGKKYIVYFNTAMWKDSGATLEFTISSEDDPAGAIFTQTINNAPNANGSKDAVIGSTRSEIEFTPEADANYILKWNAEGWKEVLLANVGVKVAPATVDTIPEEPTPIEPLFADGTYYIYNIGVEKYLAAGSSWGTHAVVNADGLDYAIAFADGKYTLDSQVSNGGNSHFLNGEWNDGAAMGWIFAPIEGAEGVYTISNGEKFLTAQESGEVTLADDATAAGAQWTLKTLADRLAELSTASAAAPVDATFLIQDANFGRNDLRKSAWTIEAVNKNLSGGNNTNNCAESYHSAFTLSQVLAGAPKGVYAMTAQGFYRQDGAENDIVPYFFANDEKMTFPVKTGTENSMSEASASFTNGLYTIDPIFVEVTEAGQLTIGAKCDTTTVWAIWDNFVLTYYGAGANIDQVKNAALFAQLDELKGQLNSLLSLDAIEVASVVTELQNVYNNASGDITTVELAELVVAGLQEAIAKGEGYVKAKIILPKMKQLVDATNVYTEEAYNEYYGQWIAKYEAGTLTAAEANALQDPFLVTGWHAALTCDNFLLSAWDTNPDFNNAAYYINSWSVEGENDGSEFKVPFFEYWTGDDNSLDEKTMTATMNGLEAGEYDVTAWVRVRAKNGYEAPAFGITLQANDGEAVNVADGAQVGESQFYLKEVTATGIVAEDGVLNIKFIVAADNNISWLSFKNVKFEKKAVEVVHTWDFTKWSEATVANLKADAAESKVAGWSDVEKKADAEADAAPTEASKDNCFWATIAEGGELTANGVAIEELKGLQFDATYTAKRALAIAVNYPETSLGTYNGPAYLWLGGKNLTCFTIPAVKAGSIIKMGVESHKPAEARGVKLFVGETELTDAEDNAVAAPTTYTEQTWQVPEGDVFDVVVKNTIGCHIYFIDAEIGEPTIVEPEFANGDVNHDNEVDVTDVVIIIDEILLKNPQNFDAALADVNHDSEIDVTDVVLVIDQILGKIQLSRGATQAEKDLTAYTAFQMDLTVPAGYVLEGVELTEMAKNSHKLAYSKLADGRCRVVVFSMDNEALPGAWDEVIRLNLRGQGDATVNVDRAMFVTVGGERHELLINGTTSIAQFSIVNSQFSIVYDLTGRKVEKTAKGVYIENGRKVVVR